MRLIDADELITAFPCGESVRTESVRATINHMPTIEVSEGEWLFEEYPDGHYHSECSICKHWFIEDAFLKPYKHCPKCGAKMKGTAE